MHSSQLPTDLAFMFVNSYFCSSGAWSPGQEWQLLFYVTLT